jgi:hypothetical protein
MRSNSKAFAAFKDKVTRIIERSYLIHLLTDLHYPITRLFKCLPALGNSMLRTRFASLEYLQSEKSICNALNASHRSFSIDLPSSNREHPHVLNAPKRQRNVITKFLPPKLSPSTTSQLSLLFCSHLPDPSLTVLYTQ